MSKSAPDSLYKVARTIRNEGYAGATIHYNDKDEPGIMIPGRGRYEIVSQGDRGYYWQNASVANIPSDMFTCDLYLSDGEEIAEHLLHLLEDE